MSGYILPPWGANGTWLVVLDDGRAWPRFTLRGALRKLRREMRGTA